MDTHEERSPFSFAVRSYSKTELAQLYFPQASPEGARHMLMRYIGGCQDLLPKLEALRYRKNHRVFTAGQVRAIIEALDEP